jgi:P27 family predicted phage terminase small subunit
MAANIPVRHRRAAPAPVVKAVELPPAPKHLSVASRRLWDGIVSEWMIGVADAELLTAALEQLDSYKKLRTAAAKQPTFKTETGNIRANPAAKMAHDALREFRMCMRQLGLDPPKV